MNNTPKSLRLHIGLFGRTNVGKSSFLNLISAQDVSITSNEPGTTTDVVEKTMELLPIGPVVFLDTAGLDDSSSLSSERIRKSNKIYERADVICLLIEANTWTDFETAVVDHARSSQIPVIIVINKTDITEPTEVFLNQCRDQSAHIMSAVSLDLKNRALYVNRLKERLIALCPEDFLRPPALIGDLLSPGGVALLIVPIDLEAPKGRLILPQVQTIRDSLDNDALCLVTKEREYAHALSCLKDPPDIVVCDSQVVLKMVADTPPEIKCTTFSILFARYKADLIEMARGAARLESLRPGDKVLIAEACSHHAIEDDIGRVKIPRWIRQFSGAAIQIDTVSGKDFPESIDEYAVIIHCGACMFNRKEMLYRIQAAKNHSVAITNYGLCISLLHGVLGRVLEPFPAAYDAYKHELKKSNKAKI
jgi:[FeFe] hydrogenase H-cluster maturation GTPase HydF